MAAQLKPECKAFLAEIVHSEKKRTKGTQREFYLVVPYAEYHGQRTHEFTSYIKVKASTFEEAVSYASDEIEESSLSAKLRREINGWQIHFDLIHEANLFQRKKCHDSIYCSRYSYN